MQASAQSNCTGPAPSPVHTPSHHPVLQRMVGLLQLPLPLHCSSHGPSAHRMSTPLQLPPPMQSTTHGHAGGHAIASSEHEPPAVHAMWQRPSSQPPVHSLGHAPSPAMSYGHTSTIGSPDDDDPSPAPDELDGSIGPDVEGSSPVVFPLVLAVAELSAAVDVDSTPVDASPLDPLPALPNGSSPDSIVQPSTIVMRNRRMPSYPAGMSSQVWVITDVSVSRTTPS